ncbi:MAG: CCA tRNA nucleotidyltransferase [Sphingorhabdus sp.]
MTAARLPDAEWRKSNGLGRVVAALADDHGGPRIVGGAVRDTLLGADVTDVDLATTLLPDVVMERLDRAGIRAIPTGLDHGTVTAVVDGKNYEITTLRRDVATDGRRAIVAFSTDWKEDAARRDFTINALYADPASGEIFDYFGGLADLEAGTVRFIGDAGRRISEDYLRILRYFRFMARFGCDEADTDALHACTEGAHGLTALSRERIAQELLKLLAAANPVRAVTLMKQHGIFLPFLPEVTGNDLQRLVERESRFAVSPSLPGRLLAILPPDAVTVDKIAARLKLSNKMRESLAMRLTAQNPKPDTIRAFAYRTNIASARDAAMLYADDSDLQDCLAALQDWAVPTLPVKGGDLIARGLSAGPSVAKTLQTIEAQWISEGFPSSGRLNNIADQAVADAKLSSKNA